MPLDTSIPVSGLTYNGQAFQLAGGEEPNLETKTVTLEAGTTEITPSSGYDGMEKVIATVEVEPVKLQTKDVEVYLGTTEIVPSYGYDGIAKVNVTARANLYMKTVTLDRGITEIYPPDGADGLNKVLAIVEPSTLPDEYVCKELMLFEAPESGKDAGGNKTMFRSTNDQMDAEICRGFVHYGSPSEVFVLTSSLVNYRMYRNFQFYYSSGPSASRHSIGTLIFTNGFTTDPMYDVLYFGVANNKIIAFFQNSDDWGAGSKSMKVVTYDGTIWSTHNATVSDFSYFRNIRITYSGNQYVISKVSGEQIVATSSDLTSFSIIDTNLTSLTPIIQVGSELCMFDLSAINSQTHSSASTGGRVSTDNGSTWADIDVSSINPLIYESEWPVDVTLYGACAIPNSNDIYGFFNDGYTSTCGRITCTKQGSLYSFTSVLLPEYMMNSEYPPYPGETVGDIAGEQLTVFSYPTPVIVNYEDDEFYWSGYPYVSGSGSYEDPPSPEYNGFYISDIDAIWGLASLPRWNPNSMSEYDRYGYVDGVITYDQNSLGIGALNELELWESATINHTFGKAIDYLTVDDEQKTIMFVPQTVELNPFNY